MPVFFSGGLFDLLVSVSECNALCFGLVFVEMEWAWFSLPTFTWVVRTYWSVNVFIDVLICGVALFSVRETVLAEFG